MAVPSREQAVPVEDTTESVPAETPSNDGGVTENSANPEILYGIQVLATSRKMSAKDSFFRGYTPVEVKSGNLYKYLLVPSENLGEVKKRMSEVSKKFPGCFIVRKEGENLSAVR